MNNEIGNLDITDRQLLATGAPPRTSLSREIGEAQITHTVFGRARVRIIRKHDNIRRSLWWIVLAVLLVLVALQVWLAWQQPESVENEDTASAAGSAMQENIPDTTPQPAFEAAEPPAAAFQPQPVATPAPTVVHRSPAPKAAQDSDDATQAPAVVAPVVVKPVPSPVKPTPRPVVKPAVQAAASDAVAVETLSPPVQGVAGPQTTQDAEPPQAEKRETNFLSAPQ